MESPLSAADEVASLCSDLIRFDTSNFGPSGAKGEREAAEYVATKLDEVGITSQLFESEPRRTTLVADWAPEGCDRSLPPLLIHGHTDVVPAVASDWQVDPFAGEIVDGYVWGRGAVDMKDFDAILLAVVRERVRTDGRRVARSGSSSRRTRRPAAPSAPPGSPAPTRSSSPTAARRSVRSAASPSA